MPRKRRKKHPVKRRDDLLEHPRLKQPEIKIWRDTLREEQKGICPICGTQIESDNTVLDHCHSSGLVRGSLHRGCNALLGKLENNYKRCGVRFDMLAGISPRVAEYISGDYSLNPFHPSHRTSEEKRLSRNERARLSRAK